MVDLGMRSSVYRFNIYKHLSILSPSGKQSPLRISSMILLLVTSLVCLVAFVGIPQDGYSLNQQVGSTAPDVCAVVRVITPEQDSRVAIKCPGSHRVELTLRDDSRIAVGSISKMFTAVLILSLVEEGALDINAPLHTYIEEFADQAIGAVPLRRLLEHTSGLDANDAHFRVVSDSCDSFPDVLALYDGLEQLHKPGRVYHYSSANYNLLALAAERVTNLSFEELLGKYIFVPLSMSASGLISDSLEKAQLISTEKPHDHLNQSTGCDLLSPYAGGAVYSTIKDLSLFGSWLAGVGEPNQSAVMKVDPNLICNSDGPSGSKYGYGHFTIPVIRGASEETLRYVFHDGRICGFTAHLGVLPEMGLVILSVSNKSVRGSDLDEIISKILADQGLALEENLHVPYESVLDWRAYVTKAWSRVKGVFVS